MEAAMSWFALNHMVAPRLQAAEFFALARSLGVGGVEIRNDLAGTAILDGTPPAKLRRLAEVNGLRILSINALQRFNDWDDDRQAGAEALADYAAACGAEALVLVPTNDGSGRANGERQANLRIALKALKPILASRGLLGLVEPLGFESCSLRLKSEAVAAIDAVGAGDRFRLVHDTFHHFVAGEAEPFPERTGLVHLSGVSDPAVAVPDMRDPHRGLVGAQDRLGALEQIARLRAGGCLAPLSFEPFAPAVHAEPDPQPALSQSMQLIGAGLARMAA
ncbi:MAG TPA: TIM barrel protein [Paracoccaceae bacterium]|nr:TIM barrel protein [Paracoccaceae bacterium]